MKGAIQTLPYFPARAVFGKFRMLFLLCLLPALLPAQSYRFRSFNVSDGLLQSTVSSITQDKEGYLWLATDGGISRYDGFEFINFTPKDGLTESSIKAIKSDHSGRLWMGTSSGKIMVRENEQFSQFKLPITGEQPTRINQISMTPNGDMWLATAGGGAIKIRFNKDTHRSKVDVFSLSQGLSDFVYYLLPINDHEILFITDLGLKLLDTKNNKVSFYAQKVLPVLNYTCAMRDKKGNLWLGTFDKGLCRFNPVTGQFVFFNTEKGLPGNFVNHLMEDDRGRVWVSCWKEGVVCIDNKTMQQYNVGNGLPGNKVWFMYQDDEKNIWFGLQDKGIASFRSNLFVHYGLEQGLSNEIVNAIYEDSRQTLWMGTNDGVSWLPSASSGKRQQPGTIQLQEVFGENTIVTSLTEGPGEKLYAGVFHAGVAVIDKRSRSVVQGFPVKLNLINTIACDNRGIIWVGANDGLTLLSPDGELDKSHTFKTDDFAGKQIVSLLKDKDGSMWIGTRGSYVYHINNNRITHIDEGRGLKHANATSVMQDENGKIFIGTEGGGIYTIEKDVCTPYENHFKNYSDYITSLACNKNGIWIGTNNGIGLVGKDKHYQFGKFEGFTEMEARSNAVCSDRSGNIWFGTNNGACCLNFSEFRFNKVPPRLRFTRFRIYGDEFNYEPNKTFSYKQNEFVFSFRAISFTVPEKVQFSYRLISEGYEEDWKKANNQQAIYTNLEPGHYIFHLKASNNNGVQTPNELQYAFEIKAPFWKTYTFYTVVCISLIGGFVGFTRHRTKKLRRDKEVLESIVKQRTSEIEDKNKELQVANTNINIKNKEITDSIRYAKNIQQAILPSPVVFQSLFPESFVFYRPKDIVSGDFYWLSDVTNVEERNLSNMDFSPVLQETVSTPEQSISYEPTHTLNESQVMLAVADCTGHGVPGAFMCMVGHSLLNQVVNLEKVMNPARVIDLLDIGVQLMLKQKETENHDGMDIALVHIDRQKQLIKFSGALRPMLYFRKVNSYGDPITDFKQEFISPDKFGVGGRLSENPPHTLHEISYNTGDTFFLFSDGICDQFGGQFGKKLMTNKFREFMHSIQVLKIDMQYARLEKFFEEWKGQNEQIDDVLVIGIKL